MFVFFSYVLSLGPSSSYCSIAAYWAAGDSYLHTNCFEQVNFSISGVKCHPYPELATSLHVMCLYNVLSGNTENIFYIFQMTSRH